MLINTLSSRLFCGLLGIKKAVSGIYTYKYVEPQVFAAFEVSKRPISAVPAPENGRVGLGTTPTS